MLHTFAVSNYRSLRDLKLRLSPLTVVTGANGSGKSNLYRALRLLANAPMGDSPKRSRSKAVFRPRSGRGRRISVDN